MKILVTGGNTFVPIDKVRGISNIFRGRTGCDIATEAVARGYSVTLLGNIWMQDRIKGLGINFIPFKTFDELKESMRNEILFCGAKGSDGAFSSAREIPDVIVHSAAISDYKVARIYPTPEHDWQKHIIRTVPSQPEGKEEYICEKCHIMLTPESAPVTCIPTPLDRDGKIPSSHEKLTMDLVPTEKIVDKIRNPWCFRGVLVKFKLQVGMNDGELLSVAKRSMEASQADIMVANCLEWAKERAYILVGHEVLNVRRSNLAHVLLERVADLHNHKIVNGFVS
jgi:phosphopantothenoylcysteine synthetase/decarboxylase